jgi:hypothetical protein
LCFPPAIVSTGEDLVYYPPNAKNVPTLSDEEEAHLQRKDVFWIVLLRMVTDYWPGNPSVTGGVTADDVRRGPVPSCVVLREAGGFWRVVPTEWFDISQMTA